MNMSSLSGLDLTKVLLGDIHPACKPKFLMCSTQQYHFEVEWDILSFDTVVFITVWF
jgi:hypothetical protein